MSKKVLIIGNGFDLDLGWNTRFKDFAKSHFWPLRTKAPDCPMAEFLHEKVDIECWYNLETILKVFASDTGSRIAADPLDEIFFDSLKKSLCQFIRQETRKTIDSESLAAKVLKACVENGYFSSIYTFNYTDLYAIAEQAQIHTRFDYQYVHGNIVRDSIILGIDDMTSVRPGYSYLKKVRSPHYRSHHIRYDLQECDEVVFFGLSFGEIDYPYFSDFFYTQSNCSSRDELKHITIFTKNNTARLFILEQLHRMNGGHLEQLINDNDFKIIMTDDSDQVFLKQFFKRLDEESILRHQELLESLSI